MQHCVASYAERIVRGKCSIYKILTPERATMEIDTSDFQPKISQVKLYKNGKPNQQTFEAVENWFSANLERRQRSNC